MEFNIENFKADYSQALKKQKQLVCDKLKEYELEERNLFNLQRKFADRYKKEIVRTYTRRWTVSDKFPQDDELTRVIFYLADMDISDMGLSCNNKIPQTELSLDHVRMTFTFKYFNERLGQWLVLEP